MLSAVGYQPTLWLRKWGTVECNSHQLKRVLYLSIQATPCASVPYWPAPATAFRSFGSTISLGTWLVQLGIYPAVDPLASSSRALAPGNCWRRALCSCCQGVNAFFNVTMNCKISLLADELSDEEKTLLSEKFVVSSSSCHKLQRCGTIYWSARFLCSSCWNCSYFKEILDGKHDHSARRCLWCRSSSKMWLQKAENGILRGDLV